MVTVVVVDPEPEALPVPEVLVEIAVVVVVVVGTVVVVVVVVVPGVVAVPDDVVLLGGFGTSSSRTAMTCLGIGFVRTGRSRSRGSLIFSWKNPFWYASRRLTLNRGRSRPPQRNSSSAYASVP